MKEKLIQSKRLILPVLLFISLCLNFLYLFNIIHQKIILIPPKVQEIQKHNMPNYIDSPIENFKKQDSIKRLKKIVIPNDTIKIKLKPQK